MIHNNQTGQLTHSCASGNDARAHKRKKGTPHSHGDAEQQTAPPAPHRTPLPHSSAEVPIRNSPLIKAGVVPAPRSASQPLPRGTKRGLSHELVTAPLFTSSPSAPAKQLPTAATAPAHLPSAKRPCLRAPPATKIAGGVRRKLRPPPARDTRPRHGHIPPPSTAAHSRPSSSRPPATDAPACAGPSAPPPQATSALAATTTSRQRATRETSYDTIPPAPRPPKRDLATLLANSLRGPHDDGRTTKRKRRKRDGLG